MSLSAGSVAATLEGRFSPAGFMAFDAAMKRSAATMAASEKQIAASSSRSSRVMAAAGKGGAMVLAGGVLAAGLAIGKSVKLAADFEQQLSRLKATTGASAATMQRFKKDAMDAGAATKFSALDAAKAQVELAKGGLAVKDMSGGLKAAVGLAAAGEIDLALAGETVVNAMKQFRIEGDQAVHVADALATAANTTTADVGHFAMALTQGGAAAKNAGLSLDETVALLEAFADNSVKGSDAGTSMKAMLTQLAAPTDKQANAAKRLNLELWDQQGNLKPLPAMAKALDSAFGGLTNKQRLAAASTIAGTDGMRGLLALYSSSPQAMQGYLDGLKQEGTAAEVAAEKQDNLKGKIENLKGSLETAGIQLGTGLLPGLTEGAEKLTDTINEMAASGDLERMGEQLGDIVTQLVQLGPALTEGLSLGMDGADLAFKGLVIGMLPVVGGLAAIVEAASLAADAINAVSPGDPIDTSKLTEARDRIREVFSSISDSIKGKDAKITVRADVSAAASALKSIESRTLREKVLRILGKDVSAVEKIRQITALGIPQKIARILTAGVPQTLGEIAAVRGAVGALPGSKTITLTTINRIINQGSKVSDVPPVKLGNKATGRGPGGAETSLVGEGRGGELVGSPDSGWAWVDRPTVMNLAPGDAVIPEDPRYAGRALSFMFAAMGIPGYAKGKKPKKAAPKKALAIPDAVTFGAVPEDALNDSKNQARESYQKRKDRVHDLDVGIREQRKKVGEAKGADQKSKARRKLREMQADRKKYSDGGDGLASLTALRARWQELSAQSKVLHATNMEIERLDRQQQTERTKMETASKRGDEPAWKASRGKRGSLLETLQAMYAKAVGLAKPGTTFAADLEGKLASVQGDIADAAGEAFEQSETPGQRIAREAADRLADTGMTDAERAALEGLEAQQSLAALTADLGDDQAAASGIEQFLSGILGAVQSDPARGGAGAVRDIADRLKQARDNVASFTGGGAGNESADLQAQIEQQRRRADVAERSSEINAKALTVFQGAGDIGQARIVVNQNVNTLHPGDPQTLAAIADAAVGGISQQASRTSPRTDLGL